MVLLKQAEAGTPETECCRKCGMSSASFYKWWARYGGMDTSLMAIIRELKMKIDA